MHEPLKPDLCIYHANCADGFGAAWAVKKAYEKLGEEIEFHPASYGEPAPDVTGRQVIMVDFSYKRDALLQLASNAACITILDHHKSARDELVDLPPNVEAIFDMDRSGARMAWEHFHAEPAPRLIQIIEDRDLWRFALPNTKELMAYIFSHEYTFETYDALELELESCLGGAIAEGAAIIRKQSKDIRELIKAAATRTVIGGHDIPVLNCPYFFASEAGHILAQGEPFAACYYDAKHGRVYSLRSTEDGLDVAEIARQYGGGGHKHAAGFTVAHDQFRDATKMIPPPGRTGMSTPRRIQLSRRRGYRMPPNTAKVDRSTRWGNPFVGSGPHDRARMCVLFEEHLHRPEQAEEVAAIRTELRGRNLACWCPLDEPCHADVLLRIANEGDAP